MVPAPTVTMAFMTMVMVVSELISDGSGGKHDGGGGTGGAGDGDDSGNGGQDDRGNGDDCDGADGRRDHDTMVPVIMKVMVVEILVVIMVTVTEISADDGVLVVTRVMQCVGDGNSGFNCLWQNV